MARRLSDRGRADCKKCTRAQAVYIYICMSVVHSASAHVQTRDHAGGAVGMGQTLRVPSFLHISNTCKKAEHRVKFCSLIMSREVSAGNRGGFVTRTLLSDV